MKCLFEVNIQLSWDLLICVQLRFREHTGGVVAIGNTFNY